MPLRQRPGVGTVADVIVIGLAVELSLALLPTPSSWWWRTAIAVAGVVLDGLARPPTSRSGSVPVRATA